MAVGAAVVGGAMVAGGTAAAIRAARVKGLAPNRQIWGGSKEAQDAYLANYAAQADQGQAIGQAGVQGMQGVATLGANQYGQGYARLQDQQLAAQRYMDSAANRINAYDPRALIAQQAQAGMDATTSRALSQAGSQANSALAARNAIAASSAANAQTAQQAAIATEQAEQQRTLMQAQQLNQQAALRQQQSGQWQDLAGQGLAAQQGAYGYLGQYGQNQSQFNQEQIAAVNDRQLQANMDYEARRQAERQRKSQNIWNLGGKLITGGGSIIGGAFGGGK